MAPAQSFFRTDEHVFKAMALARPRLLIRGLHNVLAMPGAAVMDEARDADTGLSHRSPQSTLEVEVLRHLRARLDVPMANEFGATRLNGALQIRRQLGMDRQGNVDVPLRPLLSVTPTHCQRPCRQVHVAFLQARNLAAAKPCIQSQSEAARHDRPIVGFGCLLNRRHLVWP